MRLDVLPDAVREGAEALATHEGETLVGWKAITTTNDGRAIPIRYMVITDVGYYEVMPSGLPVRAAVLHKF